MKKIFYLYSKSLLSKLALVAILIVGGGNFAWADDIIYFSNTSSTLTGWTKDANISINSYSPYYMYSSSSMGTLTSDNAIVLSTYRKLTLRAKRYLGSSTDPYITVKYSSNGADWLTAESYTSVLESDSYQDLEVNLTGTYYIRLECYKIRIETLKLAISDPYPTPSNFRVSAITENTATLSWSQAKDETAWRIRYSSNEDFNPDNEGIIIDYESIDDFSYTINGLTDGVTYYAAIRSIYSDGVSNWTNKIAVSTGTCLLLNSDASATSVNVPIPNYTSNASYLTKSQIIYPNSELTELKSKYITQLTFYANTSSIDWGDATYNVYLAETTTSSYANTAEFIDWSNCTKVMNNTTLSVNNGELVLELATPFLFNGDDSKNLLIGFEQTNKSSSNISSTWIAKYKTPGTSKYYGAAYYYNGNSVMSAGQSYVPKVTIKGISSNVSATLGTNGYTTFASPRALDLANLPSGLKAYKATVDAVNSKVLFTEINQAVPANTGMLLEGTAGTTYNIPVAESGTTPDGNAFLVNSTGGTFTAESGYTYYGMIKATTAADPIVFGTFAPGSVAIPTNRAYLKVENLGGASRQLVCAFSDNTTTAIAEIANKQNGQNSYFNLAGQRVDGSRFTVNGSGLKPGLYIINGKKVVIK